MKICAVLSVLPAAAAFSFGNRSADPKVKVCQNKDCCRQWTFQQSLPETLQDLLPPDTKLDIEATSCLNQCGKGPNLTLHKADRSQVQLSGVSGPMHLAEELEEHFEVRVPSKLVAAVTVMEKAKKANSFEEKDRFLSSVIQVLQNDPLLRSSSANLRAHVLRADARCDYGMFEEGLRDITEGLASVDSHGPSIATHEAALMGRAWRARADCYCSLGRTAEAEKALEQWAVYDPSCRNKADAEIKRLRQAS